MTNAVKVLEARDVLQLMPRIDALEVMRTLFRALGDRRAVQPPQTLALFPGGGGDFITYLGVLEAQQVFGAKLSPYITRPGGALVTAWTTLMSMETGRPLMLCDAMQLTTERTAATTALAVQLLARPAATRLAIIGSGAVAQAHLRQVRGLRDWSEIRVHSPKLMRAPDRQDVLHALDPRLRICRSVAEAVRDADVVMLCTSSATPVLDPADLVTSALITSISTNAVHAHEVPPVSLHSMDVYCDDRTVTPMSAGEMVLAAANEDWSASKLVADLGELLTGRAPVPDHDRHRFFRSIGLGLEDIAMAKAILDLIEHDATVS